MIYKSFCKNRAGRILATAFKVSLWHEEGLVQTVEELRRVVLAEQGLSCAIGIRVITGVAIGPVKVLAVIDKDNALLSEYGRRAALRRLAA